MYYDVRETGHPDSVHVAPSVIVRGGIGFGTVRGIGGGIGGGISGGISGGIPAGFGGGICG